MQLKIMSSLGHLTGNVAGSKGRPLWAKFVDDYTFRFPESAIGTRKPLGNRCNLNHHFRQFSLGRRPQAGLPKIPVRVGAPVAVSRALINRYNRVELYEMVWKTPLQILAKISGVSDTALRSEVVPVV